MVFASDPVKKFGPHGAEAQRVATNAPRVVAPPATRMSDLLQRYFSFDGRLARVPFFVRDVYLGIVGLVAFFATIPLFSNGSRGLWWTAAAVNAVVLTAVAVSTTSLIVRRLHDLGLSGYHAIWVGAAELGWTILSYGPDYAILLGLPLLGIGLWLLLYPGNPGENRFGSP
jgi:uncharacterized membrane protein YhaH (DUF805 family)